MKNYLFKSDNLYTRLWYNDAKIKKIKHLTTLFVDFLTLSVGINILGFCRFPSFFTAQTPSPASMRVSPSMMRFIVLEKMMARRVKRLSKSQPGRVGHPRKSGADVGFLFGSRFVPSRERLSSFFVDGSESSHSQPTTERMYYKIL